MWLPEALTAEDKSSDADRAVDELNNSTCPAQGRKDFSDLHRTENLSPTPQ